MTEDEAKTKWCPFVRMPFATQPAMGGVIEANLAINRLPADLDDCGLNYRCIGSECMAFRCDCRTTADHEKGCDGYCGLAGKV